MKKPFYIRNYLVLGAFCLVMFLVLPKFVSAIDSYSLDLSLTGGEEAAISELNDKLGIEGQGWEKWYGSFTDEGYLLNDPSALVLKLGDDFPIQNVNIEFEAKGIDNAVSSLSSGNKDGYLFNMWSTEPGWCEPCASDGSFTDCEYTNWGFGIKKWPANMGHSYSNSILVQGVGMFNGTAVPGAGVGDDFDWEQQEGFYKVQLVLNGGSSSGELSVTKPNGIGVLKSLGGVPYGPPGIENRDGVIISVGGEFINGRPGISYKGVTIRNLKITAGLQALPADRTVYNTECEEVPTDDVDDPNNPYDTCACHAIPDITAPPPCEDPIARADSRKTSFLDTGFPFKFAGLALQWTWSLGSILDEGSQKEEELAPMPEIMVTFAPPSPLPYSDVQAVAAVQSFRTRMQNLYFGWCMVDDARVYPFNNVVAGGRELPELTQPSLTWEDGGCCQPITRTPEEDLDNDGMDDGWERLKFLNRSDYGYTSIEEVLPNDDPDGDGYFANTFKNNKGEYLTVTPYLVDSLGNTYATGGEDSKLTNIEEYILDTDPLNGDTDGDGYKDEMDFIGVGQMEFQFPIEKEAGPEGFYDVSVTAVGINDVKKTSFVSNKRRLFVGSEGALKVNLQSSRPTITFGDDSRPVILDVTLLQGSEDMADMFYEWSFNNEPACDGNEPDFPELCDEGQLGGIGKNSVTLGGEGIDLLSLPEPTSGDYPVSVRVTSPVTGNEDQTSINLNTALPVNLVTDGCGGQIDPVEALPADSKIPTMVCISEIEQLISGDDTSLNFVWLKDGQVDSAQSGLGKSQYALFPTKPAGESHTVAVIVKDAMEAKEIVNAELTLPIEGPAIEITSPPVRSRDPMSPAASRYITGRPGQDIEITAELKNFNSSEGFEYTWIIGGDEPYSEEINNSISTYSFKIPEESSYGSSFDVSVVAKSLRLENIQQASESLTLVVSEDEVQIGSGIGFFENLAAVFSVIPAAFQKLLTFAAIAAAVFFGLVYLYPKIPRRVLNKLPLGHKEWRSEYRSPADRLRQEKKLAHKLRHEQRHNFSDEEDAD